MQALLMKEAWKCIVYVFTIENIFTVENQEKEIKTNIFEGIDITH